MLEVALGATVIGVFNFSGIALAVWIVIAVVLVANANFVAYEAATSGLSGWRMLMYAMTTGALVPMTVLIITYCTVDGIWEGLVFTLFGAGLLLLAAASPLITYHDRLAKD